MDTTEFQQTPEEKLTALTSLRKRLENDFVILGELLSEIKRHKIFRLKGYKNFKDFVEAELNLSGAFAAKLVGIHDLYGDEMELDENTRELIGLDRLTMIRPLIKNAEPEQRDEWVAKAETRNPGELREEIKEIRQKEKVKSTREIFIDQYLQNMLALFNCSRKELDFKLAVYFQDTNLDEIKKQVKDKQKRLELDGRTEEI
jgi:hypothetical protein